MARMTRVIVTNAVAAVAIVLMLPPPQLPNTIALSAAIAVAVAITHLFNTAIKQQ